ncbi:MAG TPA: HEPN domain-containing protein [Candidatus Nitrosotenuis sp.]|nr:HEPN domain-containing protein [Candidatus Nitrosotenuis sp.]
MLDQNLKEARRWLTQSRRDLAAARASAAQGFYEWACFQSQQAAEKALKAFLYRQGERPVLGHSILRLLERCSALDPSFREIAQVRHLDEVYIPSRYPNGLPDGTPGEFYGADSAEECIRWADSVISFVTPHIET